MALRWKSMEWGRCPNRNKPVLMLATGFGLGLAPVASGTAGTLPGILLVLLMTGLMLPLWAQVALALVLSLIAIPICDVGEKHFGKKDDGRVVADEYMTFPLCMLGLPPEPWMLAIAFVVSRVLDIIKPFPARQFQDLPGGLGILADDFMSSIYSLAINHLIYQACLHTLLAC